MSSFWAIGLGSWVGTDWGHVGKSKRDGGWRKEDGGGGGWRVEGGIIS